MDSRNSNKNHSRGSFCLGDKKKQKKKKKSKRVREKSDDFKGKLSSDSASPIEADGSETPTKLLDAHFDNLRQSLNQRQGFLLSSGYKPNTRPAVDETRTITPDLRMFHDRTNGNIKQYQIKNKTSHKAFTEREAVTQSMSRLGLSNGGLPKINSTANISPHANFNESLRWDFTCDDPEGEKQRILMYKINRRKRYLAQAQNKNGVDAWRSTSKSSIGSLEGSGLTFTIDAGITTDAIMADVVPAVNAVIKVHPQIAF